ncbi:MAG: sodium:proton antiporter [Haliscomenobacteraceae bacterium CHB4]|nr:Na(+)/H(+) antiporter NhaD [Saprospiraceae bacterium]MCE7923352.1 sodium:proton antiporter [Haliscomenobacteraceae bacterium CHB4]
MTELIVIIFLLGYTAITLEHSLKINKAAFALVTGVLCWTLYILGEPDKVLVAHHLTEHMGEISEILFFLLGAMVVVELIDAHDGFEIVTERIRTTNKKHLMWLICGITFFMSALLDNLTTTIVMVSLLRKLMAKREERILFTGLVVVAANAGGAWSPMGDVTTTMLWIGGQITALNIVKMLILPSLACIALPLLIISYRTKGKVESPSRIENALTTTVKERNSVFAIGLGVLLFVPIFKTVTHLPPFMGMLLGLGMMWIVTEMIHEGKDEVEKGTRSVVHALRKIDTPSILFFLGILVAVSALQSLGLLRTLATWLDNTVGNITVIVIIIGFLSAIVDNVPLVAAAQGMYTLEQFPTDHYFWEFLAYCAGTGGSALIIGSAAGVAAMGMERIDFFWYLRRITFWAIIGYLAGAVVFILQYSLFH